MVPPTKQKYLVRVDRSEIKTIKFKNGFPPKMIKSRSSFEKAALHQPFDLVRGCFSGLPFLIFYLGLVARVRKYGFVFRCREILSFMALHAFKTNMQVGVMFHSSMVFCYSFIQLD